MIAGLGSGLAAALCQSLSFLGTRHYARGRGTWAARQLLVVGHAWMGLLAGAVLCLLWPAGFGWEWVWAVRGPLIQMMICYLIGQIGMMLALHHAEPSRVSPLMGLKIVSLAWLSAYLPQPQLTAAPPAAGLTWMQWSGVVLAVAAAVGLNYAGSKLRKRALGGVLLACAAFTFSDWSIARTNVAIALAVPGLSAMRVSFLNAGLCYTLTGLVCLSAAPWWGTRKVRDWADAVPFAVMWFGGMLFLYWCFAEVGPLLGAILQSTRGLISILLGSLLVYRGHHHIEPANSGRTMVRRLAAGVLMFVAVGMYVLKEPGRLKMGLWHSSNEGPPWKAQPILPPASAGTSC